MAKSAGKKLKRNVVCYKKIRRKYFKMISYKSVQQKWSFNLSFFVLPIYYLLFILSSCSVNKQITKQANKILLEDSAIRQGHIGISIFEPATGKYWYEHDAEKYFVPASNTKLFTLYAGMKYLGDSLIGLRYNSNPNDNSIIIQPTGDPSFLHSDFTNQPVLDFLKNKQCAQLSIVDDFNFLSNSFGKGWAWDDFGEEYMAERSAFPINGNLASFYLNADTLKAFPAMFDDSKYSSIITWNKNQPAWGKSFNIYRKKDSNFFQTASIGRGRLPAKTNIPFISNDNGFIKLMLEGILNCKLGESAFTHGTYRFSNIIHSQPSDSVFKPMMHRSDNFFAEQTLIMASNEHLGYMSDERMIDTLLKTDLKDIPQQPKWVDGSGLSRYNLFTPQDFVYLLKKIKDEFDWKRIQNILPTGGEGTLSSYYKSEKGYIFAKTGTLSNNCALSGYLITKKNKVLIFSILVNNYKTGATPIRRSVEGFLQKIRNNY